MTRTTEIRRLVMQTAWGFWREEAGQAFGSCLRRGWAFVKKMIGAGRKLAKRAEGAKVLQLSPSLIRSPIARVSGGGPRGRYADFKAARTTAFVGR